MRKVWWVFLSVLLMAGLIYGCGQKASSVVGYGTAIGTVYAADGTTPLGGVRVWTTGSIIETYSNADGSWTLQQVPLTAQTEQKTIYAETGSWKISFLADMTVDQETQIPAEETTFSQENLLEPVNLGVIKGSYDSIEDIIVALGYQYTTLEVSDLDDYNYISTFEAIFINCGAPGTSTFGINAMSAAGQANLRNFVEQAGGSLYASDWAADFVEKVWPSAIDFYGSDTTTVGSPEDIEDAKVGNSGSVEAIVEDLILRNNVLSKEVASLYYDLGAWVVISAEGTGTDVLLRGSPEVSSFTASSSVIDRSDQRLSAANVRTMGLLNGSPLAVRFQPAGSIKGTVIYTTFHNEAQVTEDAEKILRYFIMNL